jgi:hypothetical protein
VTRQNPVEVEVDMAALPSASFSITDDKHEYLKNWKIADEEVIDAGDCPH